LNIEGLYIPRFYNISYDETGRILWRNRYKDAPEIVKRRYIKDITKLGVKASIVTPETEFSEMYLVEAMRGCPWSCRFCVAGHVYNPFRKKAIISLENEIKSALKLTDRIGLIGPSLSDYPDIKEILKIKGVDFSITSLRASSNSAELVGLMRGHKSISIAPEAGTERLRRVIKKKITEDDIIQSTERIFSEGVETLRLYFMIGLPTETKEDVAGIVNLVKKIRDKVPKGNISLSISTFVPKPFTPFQWHPMERLSEIKERLKMIKNSLLPIKDVRVFHDVPKYAYMQGIFSQGDRRVSRLIEEMLNMRDWRKAAEKANIIEDFYIFRKKDYHEILPWDFIDVGISKERLWSEYQEAIFSG